MYHQTLPSPLVAWHLVQFLDLVFSLAKDHGYVVVVMMVAVSAAAVDAGGAVVTPPMPLYYQLPPWLTAFLLFDGFKRSATWRTSSSDAFDALQLPICLLSNMI